MIKRFRLWNWGSQFAALCCVLKRNISKFHPEACLPFASEVRCFFKKKKPACLEVTTCMLFKCSFHIDFLRRKSPLAETTLSLTGDLWQRKKRTRQHVATSADRQDSFQTSVYPNCNLGLFPLCHRTFLCSKQ